MRSSRLCYFCVLASFEKVNQALTSLSWFGVTIQYLDLLEAAEAGADRSVAEGSGCASTGGSAVRLLAGLRCLLLLLFLLCAVMSNRAAHRGTCQTMAARYVACDTAYCRTFEATLCHHVASRQCKGEAQHGN